MHWSEWWLETANGRSVSAFKIPNPKQSTLLQTTDSAVCGWRQKATAISG